MCLGFKVPATAAKYFTVLKYLLTPFQCRGQRNVRANTSTPPMGRTACTEPQCLYKGALYLTFTFYTIALNMYAMLLKNF